MSHSLCDFNCSKSRKIQNNFKKLCCPGTDNSGLTIMGYFDLKLVELCPAITSPFSGTRNYHFVKIIESPLSIRHTK